MLLIISSFVLKSRKYLRNNICRFHPSFWFGGYFFKLNNYRWCTRVKSSQQNCLQLIFILLLFEAITKINNITVTYSTQLSTYNYYKKSCSKRGILILYYIHTNVNKTYNYVWTCTYCYVSIRTYLIGENQWTL